ncbi:MAG: hypothetical protein NTU88_16535 [Armatimonadetes bacterium]|nr:hypothetical protein [Armatimonadota bacterium]
MDCYSITREEFEKRCPFPFKIVRDHAALNVEAARRIVDTIRANNEAGRDSSLILPVGPLLYEPLAEMCNVQKLDLSRLTAFMMDEYLQPDLTPIPESHPLSFKGFMRKSLVDRLDPSLGFSMDRVIFPLPETVDEYSERILSMGGVDICFGGVGISGHLAFNDPPEPDETDKDTDWVRNCRTRIVNVSRESSTQMALGGTHGNWAIIPRMAVTVGMKEILASKKIILTFMRTWHAGTMRRALFGPVSADCPGSLVQEHSNVEIILTELAAQPPFVDVIMDTGEDEA